MRINWIKHVFFTVIIVLIGIAIYYLYGDQDERTEVLAATRREENIVSEFSIGISGYDTINPILSSSRDIQYISKLIYRSLLRVTPEFRIENDLVLEWSRLNNQAYLIRIQEGIHWHDGTLLTGHDVKFTIDGIKNLQVNSIYRENVQYISRVEVIDDYLIRIDLDREVPFFEYMLTFPILSREAYNEYTLESKEELPVGTGEYRIAEMNESVIVLERDTVADRVDTNRRV